MFSFYFLFYSTHHFSALEDAVTAVSVILASAGFESLTGVKRGITQIPLLMIQFPILCVVHLQSDTCSSVCTVEDSGINGTSFGFSYGFNTELSILFLFHNHRVPENLVTWMSKWN